MAITSTIDLNSTASTDVAKTTAQVKGDGEIRFTNFE